MAITANDEPTEIEADVDKRFSSIIVNLPVRQTGTGTPSPSNPRPFTMWTDVSLYVSDTEEADDPTLAIELPTPMYGGKVDMVRGEIATLYNSKESGTDWEMTEEGQFRCQVSAYNNGDETSTNVADLYAVHYETVSNKDAYDATDDLTCGLATIDGTTYLYVNDAQYTTLDSFATHIAEEVFVFRAHIPMSDVTEPHIVYLPEGTSYVWADAGFVDYTISGTPPLSLPNSLGKPLKAWSVDVLPYQEGTGDPAPDNVRAIHGTDKLTITTAGKNLLDPVNYSAYLQEDGTYLAKAAYFAQILNAIPSVCIGKQCVFSAYLDLTDSGNLTWAQVRAAVNGVVIGGTYVQNGATGISAVTFTPTSTNDTVALTYGSNGGNNMVVSSFMLELGRYRSDYVPYLAPSQTVLTLPQTVYTGTIGSEGGESRWGEVDLGTLNWNASGSTPHGFYATLPFKYAIGIDISAMCEAYKYAGTRTGAHGYYGNNGEFTVYQRMASSFSSECYVVDENYSDAASFKASVQGVKLVIELVTSTTFAVPSATIPTPTGTATTWATAEDGTVESMEVTYVGKA